MRRPALWTHDDDTRPSTALSVAVGLVATALVFAVIANGMTSLLKRIGVLDRARYETYWQLHCGDPGALFRPLGLGRRCIDAAPGPLAPERYARDAPYFRFAFDVQRSDIPLKLGKDLFLSIFVLGSLALLVRGRTALPGRGTWPLWALSLLVAVAGLVGFGSGHWLSTLLELRGMTFLAVALLGAWMTSAWSLQRLARALVILSLFQLALVPLELMWGMPISGYAIALSVPNRVAGTLVKPNTLGVLAAVTVAMTEAFESGRRRRRAAWVAGGLLIACAGSATGWIVLAALAIYRARIRLRPSIRLAAVGAASLVLIAALPLMVGRPDVYDSLMGPHGRLGALREVIGHAPLWMGEGLGAGGPSDQAEVSLSSLAGARPHGMDSTLILLLQTLGIPGAVLFYVALLAAWRRGEGVRPLLLALGLASLTLNIVFAFPMNFLLGIALASGFAGRARPLRAAV